MLEEGQGYLTLSLTLTLTQANFRIADLDGMYVPGEAIALNLSCEHLAQVTLPLTLTLTLTLT